MEIKTEERVEKKHSVRLNVAEIEKIARMCILEAPKHADVKFEYSCGMLESITVSWETTGEYEERSRKVVHP